MLTSHRFTVLTDYWWVTEEDSPLSELLPARATAGTYGNHLLLRQSQQQP
jgi:hypothetical protein